MTDRRCYTLAQARALLHLPPRTFSKLRAEGKLPMLEELLPRLGKHPRYRADLIDHYLEGRFADVRPFARKPA
jgi:hypothetical protein